MATETNTGPEEKRQRLRYERGAFSTFRSQIARFVDRYNREHVGTMPAIVLDDERYLLLERRGAFVSFLAYCDDTAAGIITYTIGQSRHYAPDHRIAWHDFFYVEPEYRSGIVPLNLYRTAERWLRAAGVKRIFQADHVRFISRAAAYKAMGYREAEVIYEKILDKEKPRAPNGG